MRWLIFHQIRHRARRHQQCPGRTAGMAVPEADAECSLSVGGHEEAGQAEAATGPPSWLPSGELRYQNST
jgi:hypothetical protein